MLTQRWLINGLLVLVIAVLAVIGYRLDPSPQPAANPAQNKIDTAAIERIEIQIADQQLLLQRQQASWVMLEPLRWPADRAAVERLFRIVDNGAAMPLDDADIDLAKLGFDNPPARLRLGETEISFGIVNNIGERRYTLIDSALYLLPDIHLPLILQGSSGFLDRRLLPPVFEITVLSLPGFELRRNADGAWQAVGQENISAATLAALVDNWQALEPTRIGVYQDPRAPTARIVAKPRDGEPIELLLLATDPDIVIANPALGSQYHFHGELYDRLFTPSSDENSA